MNREFLVPHRGMPKVVFPSKVLRRRGILIPRPILSNPRTITYSNRIYGVFRTNSRTGYDHGKFLPWRIFVEDYLKTGRPSIRLIRELEKRTSPVLYCLRLKVTISRLSPQNPYSLVGHEFASILVLRQNFCTITKNWYEVGSSVVAE